MFGINRQPKTVSPEQRKELFLKNYAILEDACHQLKGLSLDQKDLQIIESVLNKIKLAKEMAETPEKRNLVLLIKNLLVLINPILERYNLNSLGIHEVQ